MKRRVKIFGLYWHITKGGRGVGLIRREIRDAATGEVLRRGKYVGNLKRMAEREGWELL